ncbi:minor capsid protein [Streptomyces zaomyceticus]|uniref:Minor capsid protein n=1 Tax=Streptomyces zaomyceticus TaxID=68286 RepID=A0ABZ1L608_9ACTN
MSRARVTWNGAAVLRGSREGALRGIRLGAEHLLAESRKVVPIEEATLERSGTATVDEASLTAAVSYDTPYAVRQHEDMDLRHDEGRTAKYVERPLVEQAGVINEIIAAQVRRSLRG